MFLTERCITSTLPTEKMGPQTTTEPLVTPLLRTRCHCLLKIQQKRLQLTLKTLGERSLLSRTDQRTAVRSMPVGPSCREASAATCSYLFITKQKQMQAKREKHHLQLSCTRSPVAAPECPVTGMVSSALSTCSERGSFRLSFRVATNRFPRIGKGRTLHLTLARGQRHRP